MHYILIAFLILLAAFNSWTSRINQFFFFGRTVSDDFRQSDAAHSITRRYLLLTWCAMLPALAILLSSQEPKPAGRTLMAVLLQVVLHNLAYGWANRLTRNVAVNQADTIATPRETPLLAAPSLPSLGKVLTPVGASALLFLAAVLCTSRTSGLMAAAGVLMDRIDTLHLASPLGFSLGLILTVPMALWQRSVTRQRTALAAHIQHSLHYLGWGGFCALLVTLACALSGFTLPKLFGQIFIGCYFVAIIALIWWRTLRMKNFTPHPVEMQGDENWHWGLFYANKQDPALLVQSRCSVGYTMNFGRIAAWPIAAFYFGALLFLVVSAGWR